MSLRQPIGFVVLLIGMSVYNDVIITPYMRQRGWIPGEAAALGGGGGDAAAAEAPPPPPPAADSDDSVSEGSGGSDDRPLLADAEPPAVDEPAAGDVRA